MDVSSYSFFITTLTTLFIIVDPVAGSMIFSSMTVEMDDSERRAIAKKTSIFGCIILLFFAVAGNWILSIFQITTNSLSVAGGILLLLIAIDMMYARRSREAYTEEEFKEEREHMYIIPLAIPMLTGPAAITSVILLIGIAETFSHKILVLLAVIVTFFLTWILLRFTERLNNLIGVTGGLVFRRMMGLFLAAIAIEFISGGIWNIYNSLVSDSSGL
ncbi:MAG: MarC family protein [Halobacteriota archaeon]|nr:MarC family protein [Halobacteriota archaeon]